MPPMHIGVGLTYPEIPTMIDTIKALSFALSQKAKWAQAWKEHATNYRLIASHNLKVAQMWQREYEKLSRAWNYEFGP